MAYLDTFVHAVYFGSTVALGLNYRYFYESANHDTLHLELIAGGWMDVVRR